MLLHDLFVSRMDTSFTVMIIFDSDISLSHHGSSLQLLSICHIFIPILLIANLFLLDAVKPGIFQIQEFIILIVCIARIPILLLSQSLPHRTQVSFFILNPNLNVSHRLTIFIASIPPFLMGPYLPKLN